MPKYQASLHVNGIDITSDANDQFEWELHKLVHMVKDKIGADPVHSIIWRRVMNNTVVTNEVLDYLVSKTSPDGLRELLFDYHAAGGIDKALSTDVIDRIVSKAANLQYLRMTWL